MNMSVINRVLALAGLALVVLTTGCGPSAPLSKAAKDNNVEWAKALIDQQKADVNAKDPSSLYTPLHWAAYEDAAPVAQLLLERGATPDPRDKTNSTPLLLATINGYTDVVKVLIAHHADVNAKDHSDWTPLMYAAKSGYIDIVRALVGAGADVNYVEIKSGDNAMALARNKGRDDVVNFLSGKEQPNNNINLPPIGGGGSVETAKINPPPNTSAKPPADPTLTPKKVNAVPAE